MKNQRDENGNKHGLWEDYYLSGKLWYKGNYKHGIFHGLWETYYPDGRLCFKGAFKRDKRVGLWHHPSR